MFRFFLTSELISTNTYFRHFTSGHLSPVLTNYLHSLHGSVRLHNVTFCCLEYWCFSHGTAGRRREDIRFQGVRWNCADGQDLVVIALSGVQRFIEESRSTSDLRAGSRIIAELTEQAVSVCQESAAELVFPAPSKKRKDVGMPNRVVALAPAGQGTTLAQRATARVNEKWKEWLQKTLGRIEETPGMPAVTWAVAPPRPGGYPEQWKEAQRRLAARKQVRNFTALEARNGPCQLSPHWPATTKPPKGLPSFERDTLSAANWLKRKLGRPNDKESVSPYGIPSTYGIASAPFRIEVLKNINDPDVTEQVDYLHQVVQDEDTGIHIPNWPLPGMPKPQGELAQWLWRHGGQWVYTDSWSAESLAREFRKPTSGEAFDNFSRTVEIGRIAAADLQKIMRDKFQVAPPSSYLAILVQDLDGMGSYLSEEKNLSHKRHTEISDQLRRVAERQTELLHDSALLGVAVYAGGDDLLAFLPAATALAGARACRQAVTEVSPELPTASSALLFFHRKYPLRLALAASREALAAAKNVPGKNARREATCAAPNQETYVQKWALPDHNDPEALVCDRLSLFTRSETGARLSPGLLRDLERDSHALCTLSLDLFTAELQRLVHRHTLAPTSEQQKAFALKAAEQLRLLGRPTSALEDS